MTAGVDLDFGKKSNYAAARCIFSNFIGPLCWGRVYNKNETNWLKGRVKELFWTRRLHASPGGFSGDRHFQIIFPQIISKLMPLGVGVVLFFSKSSPNSISPAGVGVYIKKEYSSGGIFY